MVVHELVLRRGEAAGSLNDHLQSIAADGSQSSSTSNSSRVYSTSSKDKKKKKKSFTTKNFDEDADDKEVNDSQDSNDDDSMGEEDNNDDEVDDDDDDDDMTVESNCYEIIQGENWLRLVHKDMTSTSVLDDDYFDQTQSQYQSQTQTQTRTQTQTQTPMQLQTQPPLQKSSPSGDKNLQLQQQQQQQKREEEQQQQNLASKATSREDTPSSSIYPSIVSIARSGIVERHWPSKDCFICLDVDHKNVVIKDMRFPPPNGIATSFKSSFSTQWQQQQQLHQQHQEQEPSQQLSQQSYQSSSMISTTDPAQHARREQEHLERPLGILVSGTWEALPRRQIKFLQPGDKICTSLDLEDPSSKGLVFEYRRREGRKHKKTKPRRSRQQKQRQRQQDEDVAEPSQSTAATASSHRVPVTKKPMDEVRRMYTQEGVLDQEGVSYDMTQSQDHDDEEDAHLAFEGDRSQERYSELKSSTDAAADGDPGATTTTTGKINNEQGEESGSSGGEEDVERVSIPFMPSQLLATQEEDDDDLVVDPGGDAETTTSIPLIDDKQGNEGQKEDGEKVAENNDIDDPMDVGDNIHSIEKKLDDNESVHRKGEVDRKDIGEHEKKNSEDRKNNTGDAMEVEENLLNDKSDSDTDVSEGEEKDDEDDSENEQSSTQPSKRLSEASQPLLSQPLLGSTQDQISQQLAAAMAMDRLDGSVKIGQSFQNDNMQSQNEPSIENQDDTNKNSDDENQEKKSTSRSIATGSNIETEHRPAGTSRGPNVAGPAEDSDDETVVGDTDDDTATSEKSKDNLKNSINSHPERANSINALQSQDDDDEDEVVSEKKTQERTQPSSIAPDGIASEHTQSSTCAVGELTQVNNSKQDDGFSSKVADLSTEKDEEETMSISPNLRRQTGDDVHTEEGDDDILTLGRSTQKEIRDTVSEEVGETARILQKGDSQPGDKMEDEDFKHGSTTAIPILEQQRDENRVESQSFLQETCSLEGSRNILDTDKKSLPKSKDADDDKPDEMFGSKTTEAEDTRIVDAEMNDAGSKNNEKIASEEPTKGPTSDEYAEDVCNNGQARESLEENENKKLVPEPSSVPNRKRKVGPSDDEEIDSPPPSQDIVEHNKSPSQKPEHYKGGGFTEDTTQEDEHLTDPEEMKDGDAEDEFRPKASSNQLLTEQKATSSPHRSRKKQKKDGAKHTIVETPLTPPTITRSSRRAKQSSAKKAPASGLKSERTAVYSSDAIRVMTSGVEVGTKEKKVCDRSRILLILFGAGKLVFISNFIFLCYAFPVDSRYWWNPH